MTPTFVKVGGGLLTAQDLQLQEGLAAFSDANIMIRDFEGVTGTAYNWYPKSYFETSVAGKAYTDSSCTTPFVFPEGKNGIWAVQSSKGKGANTKYWYDMLEKDLAPADAVQIYTAKANCKMTTSGEVPNEDVLVSSVAGCNYIGNPYPVTISCQDIQMQDGVAAFSGANIMFRDYEGVTGTAYNWYPKSYFETSVAGKAYTDSSCTTPFVFPEGKKGVWAIQSSKGKGANTKYWYDLLDVNLKAGEGVQVYAKDANVDITILCPYDL